METGEEDKEEQLWSVIEIPEKENRSKLFSNSRQRSGIGRSVILLRIWHRHFMHTAYCPFDTSSW